VVKLTVPLFAPLSPLLNASCRSLSFAAVNSIQLIFGLGGGGGGRCVFDAMFGYTVLKHNTVLTYAHTNLPHTPQHNIALVRLMAPL